MQAQPWTRREFLAAGARGSALATAMALGGGELLDTLLSSPAGAARPDPLSELIAASPRASYWVSTASPADCLGCHAPGAVDAAHPHRHEGMAVRCQLFTRFHPDYQLLNLPPTPVETLERARDMAMRRGIHYAYVGNVPGHPGNHTYCPGCGTVVIERTGLFVTRVRLKAGACPTCGRAIPGVWN